MTSDMFKEDNFSNSSFKISFNVRSYGVLFIKRLQKAFILFAISTRPTTTSVPLTTTSEVSLVFDLKEFGNSLIHFGIINKKIVLIFISNNFS